MLRIQEGTRHIWSVHSRSTCFWKLEKTQANKTIISYDKCFEKYTQEEVEVEKSREQTSLVRLVWEKPVYKERRKCVLRVGGAGTKALRQERTKGKSVWLEHNV